MTLTGGICWGISGTCGQYLCNVQGMDTRVLTDFRLLGAGLLLLLFAGLKDRTTCQQLIRTPKAMLHCLVFGICGLLFTQFSYITSITKTNSGTATVLQYMSAILVLIFVCVRHRKLPNRMEGISIVLCVLGTFLVATHGSLSTLCISPEGLSWGLISAFAAAMYILIPQNLMKEWGSILPIGFGMLSGGIVWFFAMRIWRIPVTWNPMVILMLIVIVFVGTALAFTLFLAGTSIVGPARGNMLGCVEPLVATLTTAIFMRTTFTLMDILGFACIMATVFLLAKKE